MNTLDRVKAIIGDLAGIPSDQVGDDTPLRDVGSKLDSLDLVQLTMEIEEHFGTDIPEDVMDRPEMGTAAGIAAWVDGQTAAAFSCEEKTAFDDFAAGNEYRPGLTTTLDIAKQDTHLAAAVEAGPQPGPSDAGPKRYRKKPVVVEAVRWDATTPTGVMLRRWSDHRVRHHGGADLFIETLEGTMEARPGDWIIRGTEGEFYPCKPKAFAATYEEDSDTQPAPEMVEF